ncbi:MAG: hypothetical protein R3214_13330 [Christiangramia sp.]|nr:hypothetical protein [Christiangramia sp.]
MRVTNYNLKFENSSDEKDGDEWPIILEKIKEADLYILATHDWSGDRGSSPN